MGINEEFSGSATFDVDYRDLVDILGLQTPSEGWSLQYTKYLQRRKHRKYRTNKKWAKRYGYKEVPVIISNIKIKTAQDGDGSEFIGEI